jgi:hypothetical protein
MTADAIRRLVAQGWGFSLCATDAPSERAYLQALYNMPLPARFCRCGAPVRVEGAMCADCFSETLDLTAEETP